MKKEKKDYTGFILLVVCLFAVILLNIHLGIRDAQMTETVSLSGFTDVYVGNGIAEIYCNKPHKYCNTWYDDGCNAQITYDWKSSSVHSSDSNYMTFVGSGECTIIYEVKALKFTWL